MENSFGAKITQPMLHHAWQSYYVSLNKVAEPELRSKDIDSVNSLAEQLMMVDPNGNFLFVVANEHQVTQMRELPTVKTIGAVNIDMERFQKLVSGDLFNKNME